MECFSASRFYEHRGLITNFGIRQYSKNGTIATVSVEQVTGSYTSG